jgi:hypothetical protein
MQPELFDTGGRVSALTCQECGDPMEHTPSGFLCCPHGHGRLNLACVEDGPSGWFEDDLTGEE